jgi:dTMP kinase
LAGVFITFEGVDGSGKSTQLRMLASELRLRGREVVATREPGGTPLGGRIRELVLDAEEQVDPLAELLLYAADRAQHVRALVRPALESGHIVLSDRYADATVASQGAGRGFPDELIAEVVALATGGLMPDLTLIFDLTVEASATAAAPSTTGSTPRTPPSTRASATPTSRSPPPTPTASASSTPAAPSRRPNPRSCGSSCPSSNRGQRPEARGQFSTSTDL